uniref:NADH-ubiquinone oxidoreductase chain 6 n=1 Tax=Typhlatya dzilamensis TaxID=1173215 RepID=A0A1Z2R788_9EUCA|nr:NADH dehydrogenase subunit 6 [Typhlatya dzilamensis]ASA39577.1 NADH dehydrogenase subunit 6 [Typhlatya dzilamensis]
MSLMTFLMILTSSFSIVFTKITHPLAMGAILLIQTSIIAFLMTFVLKTTWFSYILFLIFLGAMLVLFIYVASLAPNEPLYLSYLMILIIFISTFLSMIIIILDPVLLSHSFFLENTTPHLTLPSTPTTSSLSPMYNPTAMKMTLFLILYLLLTLVVVVKITATHFGPLRLN